MGVALVLWGILTFPAGLHRVVAGQCARILSGVSLSAISGGPTVVESPLIGAPTHLVWWYSMAGDRLSIFPLGKAVGGDSGFALSGFSSYPAVVKLGKTC